MEWLVSRGSFFANKRDGTWQKMDMREEYEEARQHLRSEATTLRDDLQTFLDA